MLQRVRPDQVELGMYVHSLEGSWFDHPFWRRRFLVSTPGELQKLRASGVGSIVIDVRRGRAPSPVPQAAAAPLAAQPPCSAAEEFARAFALAGRAKEAIGKLFEQARLGRIIEVDQLGPIADEITASVARNRGALISIARLRSADEYTYLHSVAVGALMVNLARHMKLDPSLIRDIGIAGLLHDVGKMAVPPPLLAKPGRFTERELNSMRAHAERGHKLLVESGAPPIALSVCLQHHERIDGSGYPKGLKGRQITLFARMAAICDTYDATTSERLYKPAKTPAEALAHMVEEKGKFDSGVLASFIQSIGIYPVGSLVRLSSDRLAVVTDERHDQPTRPLVRAFYSTRDRRQIAPVDVPLSGSTQGERIVSQESPGSWELAGWPSLCASLLAPASASAAA